MWPWQSTSRRPPSRWRARPAGSPLHAESLEPRQVMAVSVLAPLPDVVVPITAGDQSLSLAGRYDDTAVGGTVVRFDINTAAPLDKVYVELFDAAAPGRTRVTPITAANFLKYADGGHYADTMIHRSVPGFIVQGGGFNLPASGSLQIGNVTNFGQIANEPGPVGSTNVRGTIAMAKLGGLPNSASNQWFFNLADNTDRFNPDSLDNQNGGFTTFGRVLGNGMNAIDAIAGLKPYDLFNEGPNSVFAATPLRNIPNPAPAGWSISQSNFVLFPSISRVGELVYSVTTDNPSLVSPSITDGRLNLAFAPGASGTAAVSVRVASVFDGGDFVVDTFTVTRQPPTLPTALAATNGSTFWLGELTSQSLATRRVATLPTGQAWAAQVWGDFDGDGQADVAARDTAGAWWVGLTPPAVSAPTAAVVWDAWTPTIPWEHVMAIDVTGDGRHDIVGRDAVGGGWWVARSTGSGFATTSFGGWSTSVAWATVMPGDFNRDGRADIAARDPTTGTWWVATSTGSAFTTTLFGNWPPTTTWEHVAAGDFDGDGRTDIIGRTTGSGAWFVARSTGSAFISSRFGAWTNTITWGSIVVGDFDGDGRSDLAGRDQTRGHWWISRSTGTGFATARAGSWSTTITWQAIVVVDLNGDGRADIAGRDATTGAWWLAQSEGSGDAFRLANRKAGSWSRNVPWSNIQAVLG